MNVLSLDNIVKDYKNHRAVDHVSFDMKKGNIFGLLGPNGAGKTSLIRIITSITAADSGTVLLDGNPINHRTPEHIGYMPEERGLYKKMKVGDHLVYLASLKGLDKKASKKKIDYWLERLEIASWYNKKVQELSKGMQQKIQFIATVLHEPSLIILDEPFSGLDPVNTGIIKEEIMRLNKQGSSIIFSTHRMESVEEVCEDLVLINQGKVQLTGNVDEVKESFKENKYFLELQSGSDITSSDYVKVQRLDNNKFELKGETDEAVQTFLRDQLNTGARVKAFEEILPSINDIFIKLVKN
jgi:ABC-2 type transport system ATP-binding protein